MFITIDEPYAMTDVGLRRNNEDSVFPEPEGVSERDRLFLVCDGVGGAEKGEVASALACESINSYFNAFLGDNDADAGFISKAVSYAESCFDTYVENHPGAKGMATTLALLYLSSNGVSVAHVGDSRVYQFRNGHAIYQTKDHSLVESLVEMKLITPEEAAVHPKRNIILRAIEGTARPAEVEVTTLNDVEAGDYFFLCSDGVLEHCPTETLESIFATSLSPLEIKIRIAEKCAGKTRDNYSFYLIHVRNVRESGSLAQNILSFLYSFI